MTRRWGALAAIGVALAVGVGAAWAMSRPVEQHHAVASPAPSSPHHAPTVAPGGSQTPQAHPAEAHPTPPGGVRTLYETTRDDLLATLGASGPRAALARLELLIHADPRVSGLCHAIAHDLGHAALARAQGDASVALRDRNDVCGGGYTHGIIEVALGASKHPARDLLRVCAPRQDGSCFHGVGHGLMFATHMDDDRSLSLCDRAPDSTLAHRCAEGVFMQLFSADAAAGHMGTDTSLTAAQARDRCQATRASYAANCWFYSPNVWLAQHPDDFSGALAWCAGAGSPVGRSSCAKGTGSRTVKYHPDDLRIGEQACAEAGVLSRDCVAGMASYWSVHWKGERPPADLCHRLARPRMRTLCQDAT